MDQIPLMIKEILPDKMPYFIFEGEECKLNTAIAGHKNKFKVPPHRNNSAGSLNLKDSNKKNFSERDTE